MRIRTNAAVFAFLRANWLITLIVLLLLFLLPKLISLYAILLQRARELVDSLSNSPGKVLQGVKDGLTKAQQNLSPVSAGIVTVGLIAVTPAPIRVALSVWALLDFFKGDESITVSRTVQHTAPADDDGPVITPENNFSPANVGDFI